MDIPLPGMCPWLASGKRLGLGREEADYPRELDAFLLTQGKRSGFLGYTKISELSKVLQRKQVRRFKKK